MKTNKQKLQLLGFFVSLCPFFFQSSAFAAGYHSIESEISSLGLGGASAGNIYAIDGALRNPAIGGFQLGFRGNIGLALANPTLSATSSSGEIHSENGPSLPPVAHVGYTADGLSIDLGLQIPYGSSIKWPEDWVGRYTLVKAHMAIFRSTLSVAYQVGNFAMGIGFIYDLGRLNLNQKRALISEDGEVDLQMSGGASGFTAGILAKLHDKVHLGLTFVSGQTVDFKGQANFSIPASFQGFAEDGPVIATLEFPHKVSTGVVWKPLSELLLTADLEWWNWSRLQEFTIDFASPITEDVEKQRDWNDTLTIRLGTAYQVSEIVQVKIGGFFDQSPVPHKTAGADSPDSDRLGLSTGLTLSLLDKIHLNLAYQWVNLLGINNPAIPLELPNQFNGTFHVAALGLSYGKT